jgi:membrane protein
MQGRLASLPGLFWRALRKFMGDNGPTMAAAISFTTVFSLPALLAVILMLVGRFTDPDVVRNAIVAQVRKLIGPAGAEQVQTVIAQARGSDVDPSVTAILGSVALLFGATAAFAQLQAALNRTWNVKPDPRRGEIRNFLVKRVFSFGVVLVVAFLLLVSLTVSAAVGALDERMSTLEGPVGVVLRAASVVLSFAIVTLLFAAMFKLLPDAKIAWRDVVVGAACTAVLFEGGKSLIGLYLGSNDPGTAFGAAGSLALVLLWIYYSAMIVLYGAELTRGWADTFGRGVKPQRGAIEFVEQEKAIKAG